MARILAINDLSCIGKCSLTTALPILSALGHTVDVLPTSLLSTHTGGFVGYTFSDLTSEMKKIVGHWKTLGVRYDYIYSGYLGNIEQIDFVKTVFQDLLSPSGKIVVDPVMADNGTLYKGFSNEYVVKMRELVKAADFILPNFTEACFLTDTPYSENPSEELLHSVFNRLKTDCPCPIITGVTDSKLIRVYFDEEKTGTYAKKITAGMFHGAGDVFASAFTGLTANGLSLKKTVKIASDFTTNAIERTAKEKLDTKYGLDYEKDLRLLTKYSPKK